MICDASSVNDFKSTPADVNLCSSALKQSIMHVSFPRHHPDVLCRCCPRVSAVRLTVCLTPRPRLVFRGRLVLPYPRVSAVRLAVCLTPRPRPVLRSRLVLPYPRVSAVRLTLAVCLTPRPRLVLRGRLVLPYPPCVGCPSRRVSDAPSSAGPQKPSRPAVPPVCRLSTSPCV